MYKIITLIVFIPSFFCYSQTKIIGKVTDGYDIIYGGSVILKDSTNSFIDYTYTNEYGIYELKTNQKGKFSVEFTSLGYSNKIVTISIQEQKEIEIDIVLNSKSVDLNEVIIRVELDIAQKKDTIVFNAKTFAQGNEEVVEDLLKKIPGLTIEQNGTIKVGDQEVEKVMVEGDDFFQRGYKLLTNNMPVYPIDKIELLQNYSSNHLLKDIEESERVALNLKLDKDAKRIWFGNMTLGYDAFPVEDRYLAKGNLMNFGKRNKYYFLINTNNVGYDATGDINHLVRSRQSNEPASIGDDQNIESLINLSANSSNFKRNRVTFNKTEMVSLNAIFNPTKKLKIKT